MAKMKNDTAAHWTSPTRIAAISCYVLLALIVVAVIGVICGSIPATFALATLCAVFVPVFVVANGRKLPKVVNLLSLGMRGGADS